MNYDCIFLCLLMLILLFNSIYIFDQPHSLSIITGITFWRWLLRSSNRYSSIASWTFSRFFHNFEETNFFISAQTNSLMLKSGDWAVAFAHKNAFYSKKSLKSSRKLRFKSKINIQVSYGKAMVQFSR